MPIASAVRHAIEGDNISVESVILDDDDELTVTAYANDGEELEELSLASYFSAYVEFCRQLDIGAMHVRVVDKEANKAVLAVCRPEWLEAAHESTDDPGEVTPEKREALQRMRDTRVVVNPEGIEKLKRMRSQSQSRAGVLDNRQ